jgi:hypothetical protein
MDAQEGIELTCLTSQDETAAHDFSRAHTSTTALLQDAALDDDDESAGVQLDECGHEFTRLKAVLVWQDVLRDFETFRQLGGHDTGCVIPGRGLGIQNNSSAKLTNSGHRSTKPIRLDGATLDQC